MVEKKKAVSKKKATREVSKKRLAYLDGKITVKAKENPKRKGTASFKRFELYKKNSTIGAYLKAGGTQRDLDWDAEKEFVKFKPFSSY